MAPLFTGSKFGFFNIQSLALSSLDPYFSNVSLLLHMDGSEGSTNFVDSSNNSLTVTSVSSATITKTTSKYGWGSGNLSGVGYLSSNYNQVLDLLGSSFTVESWVYRFSVFQDPGQRIAASGGGAVAWNTTNGIHWLLQTTSSGNLQFQVYTTTGAVSVTSSNVVNTGTWTHVAVSVSGSVVYLSVNGVITSGSIGTIQRPSTNPTLNIGSIPGEGDGFASNYKFRGYMDDFRITKGVARYTSNFSVPTSALPDAIPPAPLVYSPDPYFSNVSLLLHMNGSAGSTNFVDNSSNNFTVTASGPVSISSTSILGTGSGYFTGANSYLSIPNNSAFEFGTGDFTIEFFLNITSIPNVYVIYNKSISGPYSVTSPFTILIWGDNSSSGRLFTQVYDSSGNLLVNDSFSGINNYTNTWHHYALCRSGNTFRVFWNGANRYTSTSSVGIGSTTAAVFIGAARPESGGFENLPGYLDEFRITKGVARYTSNFTPTPTQFAGIPTLSITTNKQYLLTGQTSTITFSFTDIPVGFDLSDITVTGGYLTDLSVGANSYVYTATFNPTSVIPNDTASITVAANSFTSPNGVANLSSSLSFFVNITDPYFSSVSLLLHMDGTNNSTTFTDFSPNAFTVTPIGNAKVTTANKKFGTGGLSLDGVNSYLRVASNSAFNMGTGDWTIEFWTYSSDQSKIYPAIIANGSPWGTNSVSIRWDDSSFTQKYSVNCNTPTMGVIALATGTYSFNQWRHIAVVRNGTSLKIYVDGTQAASTTISSSAAFDWASGGYLYIGYSWDASNSYMAETFDDIRITKGVARYTSNFAVPTDPFPNS